MRLFHALLSWLSVPDRWARWMVLKVVCRLVRLDYPLNNDCCLRSSARHCCSNHVLYCSSSQLFNC